MAWTNWRDLTPDNLNKNWIQSAGVYYIRVVSRLGRPSRIRRILGHDPEGTLYIGMAGTGSDGGLCNRLWGLWTAIVGKDETPHDAGRTWRRLISRHFPRHRLQYCCRRLKDAKEARRVEKECLNYYQKLWGELPPLNRAGVKRS